jgi:type IX secretion system PorP/SprF family membrane protein
MNWTKLKGYLLMWMVVLLSGTQSIFGQQLPLFSGYMFNTLEINPAYAGFRDALNVTTMLRKQWTGFKNAPQSTFLSVDMPISNKRVGVGLKLVDDRDEITKTLGAQAVYSFKIPTGPYSTLALGFQGGAYNFKTDYTKIDVMDLNDPSFSQNVNTTRLNFGTGIFFNTDKFYVSLSSPNLVRNNLNKANNTGAFNDLKQYMHIYFTSGYVFEISRDLLLKPSFLVRGVVGSPLSYDINTNLWIADMLSLGFSYRNQSAVVGIIDFKILPELRVGYAYDRSIARLNIISKGSHEVILRYEFSYARISLSPRYF